MMAQTVADPLPEIGLASLAGSWEGEEDIAQSQWTSPGRAISKVEAQMVVGGIYLDQHYRQFRDGAPSFESRNIVGRDRGDGAIRLYGFDSAGYLPPEPAKGAWQGNVLRLARSSPRGLQRTSFTVHDDDHYDMIVDFSADGAETGLRTMVSARFRRVSSHSTLHK